MYNDFGRGFGFRGSAPAWPYAGRGRGGFPRCWYPGARFGNVVPYTAPGAYDYASGAGDELGDLQTMATNLQQQLADISRRIEELEKSS